MNKEIIESIALELSVKDSQVENVLKLLEEGNTVPFIARYRKEATGALDEEQIRKINEVYEYQVNLLKRKEDVIRLIDEKGMMTEELKAEIMKCTKLVEVEDLYRPYKEKKKTKATEAIANGLEPLAKIIMSFPMNIDINAKATEYLNEKVATIEDAIQGAKYIIAEWISDNASYRKYIRNNIYNFGTIKSKLKKNAKDEELNYVLVDTAGRLQIDEKLMDELKNINEAVKMDEVLLVLDAMIGQDAINVINGFNEQLPLTGVILTKLDGDTRGGVALSARHLTNVPIKFIGTSEKLDGLELFDAERMTSRILGMGDMMGLIEKAEGIMNEEESLDSFKKMKKGKYDLEDFLKQFNQMKKLGPIENIIKMLPGAKKMGLTDIHIDPKDMARLEAIVLSMTPEERRNPDIIKASRKERIAKGCGQNVQAVNKLLTQFEQSKKMMKMMSNGNMKLPF